MKQKTSSPKPASAGKNPGAGVVVTEPDELMAFLVRNFPSKSRTALKFMLRDQQVWVEGKPVTQFNQALQPGQRVQLLRTKPPEEKTYRGLRIVFEDAHLIVIDKAAGLLSIATDKEKFQTAYSVLSGHIKLQDPKNRLFVVHRLDRETSGLMVFAKSERVQKLLQEAWQTATKERTYLAVTQGRVPQDSGTIASYLRESTALIVYSSPKPNGGQHAVTHYDVLRRNDAFSLLKVSLETGRKNQVRVHLQDLGFPIVGDEKYGATTDPIGRLGLHAWVLAFAHPLTGEALRFETAIPRKFLALF